MTEHNQPWRDNHNQKAQQEDIVADVIENDRLTDEQMDAAVSYYQLDDGEGLFDILSDDDQMFAYTDDKGQTIYGEDALKANLDTIAEEKIDIAGEPFAQDFGSTNLDDLDPDSPQL